MSSVKWRPFCLGLNEKELTFATPIPQAPSAGGLPEHDALEKILPEYQYIFKDPDGKEAPSENIGSRQPSWDRKSFKWVILVT